MIDARVAMAATALTETAEVLEPAALSDLVPLLACGLVIAQRQMLLHLLDTEPDWPWNK
jgi:hypothetical protein